MNELNFEYDTEHRFSDESPEWVGCPSCGEIRNVEETPCPFCALPEDDES